jgi:hypothetical protein
MISSSPNSPAEQPIQLAFPGRLRRCTIFPGNNQPLFFDCNAARFCGIISLQHHRGRHAGAGKFYASHQ